MLSHFGGDTICKRALEIAAVTQSIIFWPGSPVLSAATDRDVIVHLPLKTRMHLGEIALVTTVEELWASIDTEE